MLPRRLVPPAVRLPWLLLVALACLPPLLPTAAAQQATKTSPVADFISRLMRGGAARTPPAPAAPLPPPRSTPAAPILPDPRLTPGDTLDVTLADIRTPGYSARVRDVPAEVKRAVYGAYGIRTHAKGEYEVDHLIPLSIGGSNSPKNLWPESYLTDPWNAHVKDALEYRLLGLVRADKVNLKVAQAAIARDWIAAYKKYVGPEPGRKAGAAGRVVTVPGLALPPSPDRRPDVLASPGTAGPAPAPAVAATTVPKAGQPEQKVWVNTRSGVYHGPASRYYGKTKEGEFMGEAAALAAGFHAAPGND